MSKSKKKAEKPAEGQEEPKEPSFKADGKTIARSEIVKVRGELGGLNLTSSQIRDKLGLKERDTVRRIMKQLAVDGVVKVEEKTLMEGMKGTRFFYTLINRVDS